MAFLPMLLSAGIPALMGLISGGIGIANAVKQSKGGRLRRRMRLVHRKVGKGGRLHRLKARPAVHRRKAVAPKHHGGAVRHRLVKYRQMRGKGVVADVVSNIPLLGGILGPLIRSFGGKLRHRGGMRYPAHHQKLSESIRRILAGGKGLSPMHIQHPYLGAGLSPMHIQHPYLGAGLRRHHKRGRGMLTPPGSHALALIKQLASGPLSPLGTAKKAFRILSVMPTPSGAGALVHRRGHFKHVQGHRVHVKAHTAHVGGRLVHRKGYYKHVGHKRIRVRATVAHKPGRGLLGPAGYSGGYSGGYMPYTF
jgi:hypothetical protein